MRLDLEAARERLNDKEHIDRDLGLLIDRIIETVLTLEYRKGPAEIIPFTPRKRIAPTRRRAERR
ncbi:MAG TPA: hypothetical protein VGV07_14245 [Devosia sp.]|uniref:hypothetical protein n=1 Tax=Devosia sp. TaxID=1871048 RepID=UPI002DDCA696|nr:hypothetical protein [Devosia sp.]HEV2516412.1 hypothetical protein [Devosia sp.]